MNQTHPTADQIVDYLHGELPPADDAAISAHIAECQTCATARDAEAALSEILQAHARARERDMPPSIAINVREMLAARSRPSWIESLNALLRPVVAVPVAAALVVGVYFGANAWQTAGRPAAIDASYYVDSHAQLSAISPLNREAEEPLPANETH